jgi:hypothetical protein
MVIPVNPCFVCDLSPRARSGQLLQQCLGVLEVGGVKALGELAIDQGQQLAGFITLVLALPQPA